jgi:hypothetical protein
MSLNPSIKDKDKIYAGQVIKVPVTSSSSTKSSGGTSYATDGSVVDYCKYLGIDSSFSARAKYAVKYGICSSTSGYSGSTTQNTNLLAAMKKDGGAKAKVTTGTSTSTSSSKPAVGTWVYVTGYLYKSSDGLGKGNNLSNKHCRISKTNYGASWATKPILVSSGGAELGWVAIADVKVCTLKHDANGNHTGGSTTPATTAKPKTNIAPTKDTKDSDGVDRANDKNSQQEAQSDINKYTKDVWGDIKNDNKMDRKFEPFFYDSTKPKLREKGFDISIIYGGAIQSLIELNKYVKTGNAAAFEQFKYNTVRALRGVYIRSVGQELDASGNPVYEVYEFIARDVE